MRCVDAYQDHTHALSIYMHICYMHSREAAAAAAAEGKIVGQQGFSPPTLFFTGIQAGGGHWCSAVPPSCCWWHCTVSNIHHHTHAAAAASPQPGKHLAGFLVLSVPTLIHISIYSTLNILYVTLFPFSLIFHRHLKCRLVCYVSSKFCVCIFLTCLLILWQ